MHEFAICRSLLDQVTAIAERHGAARAISVTVDIGPLSGVEPALLDRAFSVARIGTCAQDAELSIESAAIRVRCRSCAAESTATANRLVCAHCGDWRTDLLAGDELFLTSVELECDGGETDPTAPPVAVDA